MLIAPALTCLDCRRLVPAVLACSLEAAIVQSNSESVLILADVSEVTCCCCSIEAVESGGKK